MPSRRAVILGGLSTLVLGVTGGLTGIETGVLPGRIRLAQLTGGCDVDADPAPAAPQATAPPPHTGRFHSAARGREVGWSLALPPGTSSPAGLPVVLALHGRSEDHASAFTQLRLHEFLAAYVRGGGTPFALASIDGGDSYWHPRAGGDNPLAMVTREFLPLLASRGLQTHRIGALGWSMGGYGALLFARESHRHRFGASQIAVAAAASPALFTSYRSSAPGAFDSAGDFASYGGLAADPDVGTIPLFVACGSDDAFTATTQAYRRRVVPTPAGSITAGCHTSGYWRSVAADELAFVGRHLS